MTDEIRYVPLYSRARELRAVVTVDAADYEWLMQWSWHLSGCGYARRMKPRGKYQQTALSMHREILGLEVGDPQIVDHINRSKLDNRRTNLRVGARGMNTQNVGSYRGAASRFRGVFPERGRFRAIVQINGKLHHLGRFDDELEAARVASAFRAEHMPWAVEEEIAA